MSGWMDEWMVLNPFKELPTAIINQIFRATNLRLRKIKECLKGGRIFDWVYEGQIFDDVFNFINASIIGDNKVKN